MLRAMANGVAGRVFRRGDETPWGPVQSCQHLGLGIWVVGTMGHGGYYVPAELLGRISERARADAKRWSGSESWYEEDCCVCHVVVAYPELFPEASIEGARRINEARGY